MEFHEKLQQLRRQKGLTQEELSQALFVSRTAVSKWESGRGYPNIDSLKEISKFYGVTIDELLSCREVLNLAEEDHRQRQRQARDLVFGLLDLSTAILFFVPLFAQRIGERIQPVSLLDLTEIAFYLKASYMAAVMGMTVLGILTLALQNHTGRIWQRCKRTVSLLLNGLCALLFVVSLQPYGAVLVLLFLFIKAVLLLKKP